MTEVSPEKPTIDKVLADMDKDIQEQRRDADKWSRWRGKAGTAFLWSVAVILVPIPVIKIVAIYAGVVSGISYGVCRFIQKRQEKNVRELSQRKADLVAAVEAAQNEPAPELKLAELAARFGNASRIDRLEKAVEGLLHANNNEIDKAAPVKAPRL